MIAGDEFGNVETNGDVNSRILCRYEYDAFGNTVNAEETITNRYGFTGEMHDSITDMYYLRARYYTPYMGRFTQADTYHGDGLNLYVYAGNNPVKYVDPSGHSYKNNDVKSGRKTYTVDPSMQPKDIEMGKLVDGVYTKNPTAQNISDLIKPGSNYVGNSKMNGKFMYVVDTNDNIIIGSRAGEHMPHPTLIGGTNPTVQGAGIVEIRGGKIYCIDNASGHFKPDSSCMTNVQNAFEQLPSNVFHRDFQGYLTVDD